MSLVLGANLASFQREPVMRVHWSSADITPPEALPLGGYTARGDAVFEPGGDHLFSTSIVLEYGNEKVALVSAEMLTIPESLVREVKKKIPEDIHLFLVATHTHCAPDSQMLNDRMTFKIPGIAAYNRKWLDWYSSRIAEGIKAAAESDQKVYPHFQIRSQKLDWNRARRQGAVPDKSFTGFFVQNRPLFAHYAAHATIFDENRMQLSGDWPGALRDKFGVAVFPGPIGDVSPKGVSESLEDRLNQFRSLDSFFKPPMGESFWITTPDAIRVEPRMRFHTQKIELPKPKPHPDFAKDFKANDLLANMVVTKFAPPEAELTAINMDNILIVGVPGEPTSEIGRRIQEMAYKAGYDHCLVISHCNGWLGYILMPEDYNRGGYEATLAFHGREFANDVLAAAQELIAKAGKTFDRSDRGVIRAGLPTRGN
ncbi:MAG: hypothetical protein KDC26_00370 [Armatimonadetes bacterium]|nr:hypothetical protein [Armatimonadota bacterium]